MGTKKRKKKFRGLYLSWEIETAIAVIAERWKRSWNWTAVALLEMGLDKMRTGGQDAAGR